MARQIGIVVVVVALIALLAAVIFPVFAQAKQSAKGASRLSEYKRRMLEAEIQADEAKATLVSNPIQVRSVIRKAELTVMVDDIDKAEAKMEQLVQTAGGYVENASGWELASPAPSLKVTSRVPEKAFDSVLGEFEKLGRRTTKSISAQDVTEQIVDMDARMKTMLIQEEAYRRMLRNVTHLADSIALQDRLMSLREQIESIQGQRKSLASLAEMSTIELTFEQRSSPEVVAASDPNWGGDAWNSALSAATGTFHFLGVAVIWLAVFSPFVLLALAPYFLAQRLRKRQAG
jgi:type II secretory pathway pseudopilin PulG